MINKRMGKRKKTRSKRWLVPFFCIVIIGGYVGWCYVQPLSNLKPIYSFKNTATTAQKVALAWPRYGEAAIGATGYGVLASQGDQKALPTASIAKVITALAVLRQRPLQIGDQGPTITLTQADVDSYTKYVGQDGSVVGVSNGEQISEYQALEALLLPSANNIAETLARWAFGSIDKYNDYANDYAHGMGLSSVKVTDPSGFLPTTLASAHDLTILGELAMQNPVFAQIVGLPSATIPVQGVVTNYNFLLGKNNNVGIKTGNNDQDPGAYLFAYKVPVGQSSVLVVGTIMGGPDLLVVQRDAQTLVQSAVKHFQETSFVKQGDVVAQYKSAGQSPIDAVATQDLDLVMWDGYTFSSSANLQTLSGATAANAALGTIQVTNLTNHSTNNVPVVLKQSVKPASWQSRLTHPF